MVLDKLGSSLKDTLKKIAKSVFVDEKLVNELIKDIQKALLQSDVNVQLVFDLSKKIKERALNADIPPGLTKKEHLINVVYDELVKFLGEKQDKLDTSQKPTKVMLVGLFGNGKTTTAAKLAKYYQKRGLKVALMSTDTWRPAAFTQLKILGGQINVPVFGDPSMKNAAAIYKKFEPELNKFDIVFIDTAGRDALSDELTAELNEINKAVQAKEKLFVIGADIGQAAQKQAQTLHDTCGITGVIITKMDGTAKGGGALSACAITGAHVKFIGVGEKIEDFEEFDPKRFVSRLLGMGDIEGLLEKAKEAISEEDAEDLGRKLLKGEFNLLDLYEQMNAVKSMGPLSKVMELIPGMGNMNIPKEALQVQEEKLKKWKFIMDSCTKEELEDPEIISSERIERIAKGSGMKEDEVRDLLKQYRQSKKMIRMMKGGKMNKSMMRKFGGMKGLQNMDMSKLGM
jgi:signal recognition particle subunit SRP54